MYCALGLQMSRFQNRTILYPYPDPFFKGWIHIWPEPIKWIRVQFRLHLPSSGSNFCSISSLGLPQRMILCTWVANRLGPEWNHPAYRSGSLFFLRMGPDPAWTYQNNLDLVLNPPPELWFQFLFRITSMPPISSLSEPKYGFWGVVARKAKSILEDDDNIAYKLETPAAIKPLIETSVGGHVSLVTLFSNISSGLLLSWGLWCVPLEVNLILGSYLILMEPLKINPSSLKNSNIRHQHKLFSFTMVGQS